MKQKKLIISIRAREEYKEVGRYTEAEWGRTQRYKYLRQIRDEFERIRTRPNRGKDFVGAKVKLKYVRAMKHYIFYECSDTEVVIVSILHTSRDPALHL